MTNDKIKRILVTGATGVAGPALVHQLLKKGYQVKIFSRHCLNYKGFPSEVERYQGDILNPEAVSQAMENIDAVFHLAAKLHDIKGLSPEETYLEANVEGTRLLVNAARSAGVRRFIFFSTINVYGASAPRHCFDERSPVCPGEIYSESKVKAENIVLDAGHCDPDGAFCVVILRVAAVYGKGMKGNYNLLIRYLANKGFLLLGSGENRRTLIFDKDLAQASLLALECSGAGGQIYNITDGSIHTFNEIVYAMCRAMGRNHRFIRVPESVIKGFRGLRHRNLRFGPLKRLFNAVEKQMESLAVSGKKAQTELNFVAEYDLDRGWHAVLHKKK